MIIAVFSLGQLISSKLDTLKNGFEEWFKRQQKDISGEEVWKWMTGELAPLRLGGRLEDFCDKFNQKFQVNMPFEEFQTIFNSMCKLDQASIERLKKFNEYLDEHQDVKFLLVSHTNYSHLNYIQQQINEMVPGTQANVMKQSNLDSTHVIFAPSMVSQCVEHPDTLRVALQTLGLTDSDTNVVSFLNTIKTFDHPQFSYVDPGKELEHVISTLEELQPKAGPRLG